MSDAVARLKVLLGAPEDSHPDWPQVRHTMSNILPAVEEISSRLESANWLVAPMRQMAAQGPSGGDFLPTRPSRGCITEYPVFAALATQPVAQQVDFALKLQALFLVAVALREYHIVHDEYRSPPATAGRSCRRISRGSYSDHRISSIIWRSSSPVSLCNQLEKLQQSRRPLAEIDLRVVSGLLPLLRDLRDDRDLRTRKGGGHRKREIETTVHIDAADDDPTSRRPALIQERPDEETRAEMLSEGLCTAHETTRETLYAEVPPSRNENFPARQLSEHQAQQRLILRARAYKTNQQQVPNRRELLHEPALAPLLHPKGPVSPPKGFGLDWTLDTLLGFMLLTGCKDEDLHDVRVWSTHSEVPSQPLALGVVLQYAEFMVPVARIPDSWWPDSEYRHHFRRPANHFYLKIPTHLPIGERIVNLASRVPDGGPLCGDSLGPADELSKKLQNRISRLNDIHHTHLTLNRISLFLWGAIYALDGDMAEALLLSNRHRRSNDSRLYYHSTQSDHLRRQYARVWGAKSSGPVLNDRRIPLMQLINPDIGSAAVPYRDSISDLVRSMKERLSGLMAGRGRRTPLRWIEIHNAMTAYVICQIQWMTGIRAVRDPIELPLYAARSGFLGVIDKDSNDEYGARVVWLIEPVQQQIENYLQYVDSATRSIFGEVNREAAFRFIAEGPSILQVNQRRLVEHLPDYPFAPNSHRHYLRTRLREKDVDGGVVDAWMGHGGIGAEPYARHSAMSPVVMREGADAALNSIWEELGWEVLPGSQR